MSKESAASNIPALVVTTSNVGILQLTHLYNALAVAGYGVILLIKKELKKYQISKCDLRFVV
jgi:predicted membrane channel-forming protein YqfA (hemolysin III family)